MRTNLMEAIDSDLIRVTSEGCPCGEKHTREFSVEEVEQDLVLSTWTGGASDLPYHCQNCQLVNWLPAWDLLKDDLAEGEVPCCRECGEDRRTGEGHPHRLLALRALEAP